jgi:hypothetical protein
MHTIGRWKAVESLRLTATYREHVRLKLSRSLDKPEPQPRVGRRVTPSKADRMFGMTLRSECGSQSGRQAVERRWIVQSPQLK